MGDRSTSAAHESGEYESDPIIPCDDRLYVVRRRPWRWSTPAVACVMAMPADTCRGASEWERILDRVDAMVQSIIIE